MHHDFSFEQVMRLSSIDRWGVVEMSKIQSVAEHSYNVTMVALALALELDMPSLVVAEVMEWALIHDLPEVVTGDIPSNVKQGQKEVFDKLERQMFPLISKAKKDLDDAVVKIVKVADFVDAIQFAQRHCVDSRKGAIISEMVFRLDEVINTVGEPTNVIIWGFVGTWLNLKID